MYKSLSSLKLGEFWLVNVFIVHRLEKKCALYVIPTLSILFVVIVLSLCGVEFNILIIRTL